MAAAMSLLLLHNPRCSKSREVKRLLDERGVDYDVREYLDEPLSLDELRILKKRLGQEPAQWLRWNEDEVRQAGIERDDPPLQLLQAMAAHPRLLQRPILIRGDEAVVGRPPEAIERLL